MRYIKTTILLILTIFFALQTFATDKFIRVNTIPLHKDPEEKLARINDSEGFTNIHSGEGNNFPIIAKLDTTDFFYCSITNSEWLKIVALKWQGGKQIEGFIHKSKVQLIETLDVKVKKALLTSVLTKHKVLANNFQNSGKSKDSLRNSSSRGELEKYSDLKYSPILEILPDYICETKDTMILQLFYATMWADKGSANEIPSIAIGSCYICWPDFVLKQIRTIKNTEQRKSIYNHIEFGLLSNFDVDENNKPIDKKFDGLKQKLYTEKKKANP
ncbi:hypothetical protein BH10BAC1_BH10BAC1_05330 [soil metagenome]